MSKVAKLIEVSLMVRVIVDENATEEQIIAASYDKFQDKLDNRELGDNLVSIENDTECPFGTFDTDNEKEFITKKMVENASHYLSDGDISTREMVERIMEHSEENGDDYIDNVEGVVVWQKLEWSITCNDFMEMI
jgi:hypothetical protein